MRMGTEQVFWFWTLLAIRVMWDVHLLSIVRQSARRSLADLSTSSIAVGSCPLFSFRRLRSLEKFLPELSDFGKSFNQLVFRNIEPAVAPHPLEVAFVDLMARVLTYLTLTDRSKGLFQLCG